MLPKDLATDCCLPAPPAPSGRDPDLAPTPRPANRRCNAGMQAARTPTAPPRQSSRCRAWSSQPARRPDQRLFRHRSKRAIRSRRLWISDPELAAAPPLEPPPIVPAANFEANPEGYRRGDLATLVPQPLSPPPVYCLPIRP